MRRFMFLAPALALSLSVCLTACRDENGGSDWSIKKDTGVPTELGNPQDATIPDIMTGKIAENTVVTLREVVVTAVDGYAQPDGAYTGDVYVQEIAGGPSSGIKLYRSTRSDGKAVTDLVPGDRVKVEGKVKWFKPSTPFPKPYETRVIKEIDQGGVITRLTSGTPPTPKELTIDDLTKEPSAATWEFVLVSVKNVGVTSAMDPKYGDFDVGTLAVDDELYPITPAPKLYDCLSLTGIHVYFYGYKLLPRSASDVGTGTGCVKPVTVTIKDIQDETSANHPKSDTVVTVTGVVSAIDSTLSTGTSPRYYGFWVQDEAGGPYSGIYVYYYWDDAAAAEKKPKLNETIELTGKYTEYKSSSATKPDTLSELGGVSWTNKGQSANPPKPEVVLASEIAYGGSKAKSYEGVLVKIENAEVESIVNTTGSTPKPVGFKVKDAVLNVENDLVDFMTGTPPTVGQKYTSISGPLHYSFDNYKILPRTAADLAK